MICCIFQFQRFGFSEEKKKHLGWTKKTKKQNGVLCSQKLRQDIEAMTRVVPKNDKPGKKEMQEKAAKV
jgi:hypothetical protein